ncbi:serine protease [Streptomyces bambusae]|uniref:serine protease n=1 Tax=Streptomyces bambusae TaxID=1550616 RepID=UPI001C67DE39|nr:serine protease [Streptomyces bambusae]
MSTPAGRAGEGAGPKALDAALLRIRDGRGRTVGLGFLVSPGIALTCAHVVSAALGTPYDAAPAAGARIQVDLPLVPGAGVSASIESWVPPRQGDDGPAAGDVAVLRLSTPLPGARPLRLVEIAREDVWAHPVRAFGFPAGRPNGVWHAAVLRARQTSGWVQADLTGQGYAVSRGFSGSPVWDDRLAGVVGMMVQAESGQPPVSYLIPTDGLLAAWPGLRELALPPSPFRSLQAFQEADADVFHGRGPESDALAAALGSERWVTVVGPSGSGKSSLALAGVVPRRRAAGDAVAVLRPSAGTSPLTALAAALLPLLEPGLSGTERLARLPVLAGVLATGGLADIAAGLQGGPQGNTRLLVVVDQFEELFARADEAVEQLVGVLYDEVLPPSVRVLTTLRADFLEAALAHPRLGRTLSGSLRYLAPLGPEELREAVTAPVDAVPGVAYERHLVERILADAGGGPGALPLLGFTLDRLWQQQSEGLLTHQAYGDLGGVTGALSAYAEQVWAECVPAADAEAARRLFTRLIRVPIGSAAATRRTVPRRELPPDEWRIAQALTATRLLVAATDAEGTETVELAHEALISGWDRLADRATDDRSFLAWQETLRHDVRRWEAGGHAAELLPSVAVLTAARPWLDQRGAELTDTERDFLRRGRDHHRSRVRRRRGFLSGAAVVAVLALLFGGLFVYTSDLARDREAYASSRALAQVAQDDAVSDPVRSAMLAMAAYGTAPTDEARNQLLRQYLTHADAERLLSGLPGPIAQFDTSRDGQVVIARSTSGRAMLYTHAASGRVRSELLAPKHVITARVAPDGRRALFVADDGSGGWFEVHPDADRIAGPVHALPRLPQVQHFGDPSRGVALSGDGRKLVVTTKTHLAWWDLDTGTPGGSVPLPGEANGSLWFAPDHRTLLAGLWRDVNTDAGFRLVAFDLAGGAPREVVAEASDYQPSGDGSVAVVCRKEGDAAVHTRIRVADGAQEGAPYRTQGLCRQEAADETGRHVVLKDGTDLSLVDLEQQKVVSQAEAHAGTSSMAIRLVSGGGKRHVVAMSRESSWIAYTQIWPAPQTLDVGQQRLTLDGERTITVLGDGSSLQLRPADSRDDRLLAEAPRPQPYWYDKNGRMTLRRDGKLFADRDGKNTVSVRETGTLRPTARITAAMPPEDSAFAYAFHRDGKLVTTSGTLVQQWDPATGEELAHFDAKVFLPGGGSGSGSAGPGGGASGGGAGGGGAGGAGKQDTSAPSVRAVAYPVDDQVAVLVPGATEVRVVDLTSGRTVATVPVAEDTIGIQFDPSRRYFALLRSGGIIELWRRDPLRRELGPLAGVGDRTGTQYVASFLDGEGRYVVAAQSTIRIYRVGDRSYVDAYDFGRSDDTYGLSGGYEFMDLSADARTTVYISPKRSGGPLRLDPALWQRELCRIIGDRAFTADERRSLPVRVPDRQVCP